MIERLEVSPGPGTVVRYGSVAAWASSSASASLVSFLAESARNLAPSPVSGDQLAAHLEGVLRRRDPEPHVPFVVIGPSEDGWTALLHGPVQVWDGAAWTAPEPARGWLRTSLSPRPALSVSASGASVPAVSPDSMFDLEAGVVPGGGFLLVPAVPSTGGVAVGVPIPASAPPAVEETTVLSLPDSGPPTAVLPVDQPAAVPDSEPERQEDETEEEAKEEIAEPAGALAEAPPKEELEAGPQPAELDAGGPGPLPATTGPSAGTSAGAVPGGRLDLRSESVRSRVVPYPPLPPAGDPPRPVPGAPVVAGVPCPQGHLNRPGMPTCARCGRPIGNGGAYQVSGTRPALGCLITDQGSVYRLDSGYLIGSDPSKDPTVRGRLARPLVIPGDGVAASHAEIRLHDWDVVVTDRASEGGTHIFEPGANSWERLRAYDPKVLEPGTHLAFGQRVVTFVTPWTLRSPGAAPGQETSGRY